jgi:hypothetical protein
MEAAWITLAAVTLAWFGGGVGIDSGIVPFAIVAILGLAVARRLAGLPRERYAFALTGCALAVGIAGAWLLQVAESGGSGFIGPANATAWLLGLAFFRGSAHGDPDDEAFVAAWMLSRGLAGVTIFWAVAALAGMAAVPAYTTTAFTATLVFIAAGLLAMGLARLGELHVEAADRAARRRWVGLLLAVTALLLGVGIPVATLLDVPLWDVLGTILGPLAPLVVALAVLLARPFFALADLLAALLGPASHQPDAIPVPTPVVGPPLPPPGPAGGTLDDLTWLAWLVLGMVAIVLLLSAFLAQQRPRRGASSADEVREAEPITLGRLPRLPRIGLPRRPATPHSAVEAYRMVLRSLLGRPEGRLAGETPREHAGRVRDSAHGAVIARLAADYQLAALAGRPLSPLEERRAIERWRLIAGRARREQPR